jgi:S-(hydroxymethyl)glutathione dehydrogenase / alcohol dehydrogenase
MSTKARIAVLPPGGQKLQIQSVRIPDPGPWEVLVEQRATGVCHSQLGHIAGADPTRPLVLGHESFGIVVATGVGVEHVEVGDEVFITWMPRSATRKPQPTRVPLENGDWAVTRNVFTWGTHCLADEQYVVKAPNGLPGDLASIIGCAVMTGAGAVVNSAEVQAGESVAIWGVGGVGLVAVAAARNVGASPVIAIDIDEAKLKLAMKLGADHAVNASVVDAVAQVRSLTRAPDGVEGVDYSLDCTGRADNLPKSLAAVVPGVPGANRGGTAVLVGVIRSSLEIGGMELVNGQKRLAGCLGGGCVPDRDFGTFVDWYRTGRLDLAALVTDRYTLDQVNEAVEDLRGGRILGRAVIEL